MPVSNVYPTRRYRLENDGYTSHVNTTMWNASVRFRVPNEKCGLDKNCFPKKLILSRRRCRPQPRNTCWTALFFPADSPLFVRLVQSLRAYWYRSIFKIKIYILSSVHRTKEREREIKSVRRNINRKAGRVWGTYIGYYIVRTYVRVQCVLAREMAKGRGKELRRPDVGRRVAGWITDERGGWGYYSTPRNPLEGHGVDIKKIHYCRKDGEREARECTSKWRR